MHGDERSNDKTLQVISKYIFPLFVFVLIVNVRGFAVSLQHNVS